MRHQLSPGSKFSVILLDVDIRLRYIKVHYAKPSEIRGEWWRFFGLAIEFLATFRNYIILMCSRILMTLFRFSEERREQAQHVAAAGWADHSYQLPVVVTSWKHDTDPYCMLVKLPCIFSSGRCLGLIMRMNKILALCVCGLLILLEFWHAHHSLFSVLSSMAQIL